jgi:hypothetical protein
LPLARSRLVIAPAVVAPGFAVVRTILDAGNAGIPRPRFATSARFRRMTVKIYSAREN